MFRVEARPGNICFSRPSLGLKILGCVCVRECAQYESFEKAYRKRAENIELRENIECSEF